MKERFPNIAWLQFQHFDLEPDQIKDLVGSLDVFIFGSLLIWEKHLDNEQHWQGICYNNKLLTVDQILYMLFYYLDRKELVARLQCLNNNFKELCSIDAHICFRSRLRGFSIYDFFVSRGVQFFEECVRNYFVIKQVIRLYFVYKNFASETEVYHHKFRVPLVFLRSLLNYILMELFSLVVEVWQ